MSNIQIEDPVWQAIMSDPQLANVRRKLSFHEIRLIVRHAQGIEAPIGGETRSGSTVGESAVLEEDAPK